MVIFALENQESNPNLRQQQLEMDPDQYLQSQIKMRRQFEEFRKQQQRQTELKEKFQEKPKEKTVKVSFKKNSKANKISRSAKRVRKIVMHAPGLS